MKAFLVRLDEATYKALKHVAVEREKSLSELIREAIKKTWLKKAA